MSMCGTVASICGVSGIGGDISPRTVLAGAKRMVGILVGSRTMYEQVVRLVHGVGVRPAVDRVFPLSETKEPCRYMEPGAHFGKVVIDLTWSDGTIAIETNNV